MAHFAQIDENNIVTQVVVINNEDCQDEDGNESEAVGVAFCKSLFGEDTNWVQTSYNANFRKNYASIGGVWDPANDAFYEPKPYNSWSLDSDFQWQPPEAHPPERLDDNGEPLGRFFWDEESYDAGVGGWVFNQF